MTGHGEGPGAACCARRLPGPGPDPDDRSHRAVHAHNERARVHSPGNRYRCSRHPDEQHGRRGLHRVRRRRRQPASDPGRCCAAAPTSRTAGGPGSTWEMWPERDSPGCRSRVTDADHGSGKRPVQMPRRRPVAMRVRRVRNSSGAFSTSRMITSSPVRPDRQSAASPGFSRSAGPSRSRWVKPRLQPPYSDAAIDSR